MSEFDFSLAEHRMNQKVDGFQLKAPDFSQAEDELRMAAYWAAAEMQRPSWTWRPKLFVDGNQWCALYGEDLQSGVAGFGDSPDQAMSAFDKAWTAKLETAVAS